MIDKIMSIPKFFFSLVFVNHVGYDGNDDSNEGSMVLGHKVLSACMDLNILLIMTDISLTKVNQTHSKLMVRINCFAELFGHCHYMEARSFVQLNTQNNIKQIVL